MKCEKCGADLVVDNNQNAWCLKGCFNFIMPEFPIGPDALKFEISKDRPNHGSFVMDYSEQDSKVSFRSLSLIYDPKSQVELNSEGNNGIHGME